MAASLFPIAGRRLRSVLLCATSGLAFGTVCLQLSAQNIQYADYPQKAGKFAVFSFRPMPSWVTVSAEVRERAEGQTSFAYGEGNARVYDLTRVLGAVEVRPHRNAKLYMQFLDAHALGLTQGLVAANMRDSFDLRQGYVQFSTPWKDAPAQVTVGRQTMAFGSERLIGISDWTNTSRSFDGFFGRIGNRNRVDFFSTSVVAVHPKSYDTHGAGLTFHGAYGSIGTWVPNLHLSPFVFVRTRKNVVSQNKHVGNELETTVGAEAEGIMGKPISYMVNGAIQRGSYSTDSIHAGEAFAKLYYQPRHVPLQPRFGVEYDYASGNAHRVAGRVSTFDQLYPSGHNAFGLVDLFGFQNIREARVHCDLAPSKSLTLLLQAEKLNMAQRKDNLFSGSGGNVIKAPAAGFASSKIGYGMDVSGKYVFRGTTVVNLGVGHLFPSDVLLSNHKGSAETIGYLSVTYRFRVSHDLAVAQRQ